MKKLSGLIVVIPALNEGQTIQGVLQELIPIAQKVLVVDDGSSDNTGKVAKDCGAIVLRHAKPQGYDKAIAAGLNKAFAMGAKAVVTCDADGQHQVEDVYAVAEEVLSDECDYCAGIRAEYNRPSEYAAGLVAQILWGTKDPFCGLKCYSQKLYKMCGPFPGNMNIGTTPLIWVSKNKLRGNFLPIKTTPRKDASRFGPALRSNLKLLSAITRSAAHHLISSSRKL